MPSDFIGDLPVSSFIQPAGLPINTSTIKVLRRPVESAQYLSVRYGGRLLEAGAAASVGFVADGYVNAMAEVLNRSLKAELIECQGPWWDVDQVERAVVQWVGWSTPSACTVPSTTPTRGIRSPALPIPGDLERRLKTGNPAATELGAVQVAVCAVFWSWWAVVGAGSWCVPCWGGYFRL
ncbi:hypothetical protein [Streptomyces halobius]|uniref:Uncharacterized protein n=1 Tax=Streptomyces halobius TaxID=2879846 RepID=A0ABY4LZK1_9ACTN|nr:hypothetical protein [Streptomyces halobius]UQA90617.1 hypothetical protein K9S39_00710 [Streptomyces halobius]